MYCIHYTISPRIVYSQMLPYLVAVIFICLLLISGSIYMYRSYLLQAQMSGFKESLLNNITHELKTPLSSLSLIIDKAAKDIGTAHETSISSAHIAFAEAELSRMKLMVEKILSFSKMSREQLILDKQRVNITAVCEEAIAIMDMKIQQAKAIISFTAPGNTTVAGNALLLTNAIAAMLDNALKYSSNEPEITIAIQKDDRYLIISIQDNGIGIDKRYRKKVFEPFFRIPSGNVYHSSGHGLGLSLVKQVAELHGGTVYFASHKKGTTFNMKLLIS